MSLDASCISPSFAPLPRKVRSFINGYRLGIDWRRVARGSTVARRLPASHRARYGDGGVMGVGTVAGDGSWPGDGIAPGVGIGPLGAVGEGIVIGIIVAAGLGWPIGAGDCCAD